MDSYQEKGRSSWHSESEEWQNKVGKFLPVANTWAYLRSLPYPRVLTVRIWHTVNPHQLCTCLLESSKFSGLTFTVITELKIFRGARHSQIAEGRVKLSHLRWEGLRPYRAKPRACDGLKVCVPSKSTVWNPNPQGDGVGSRGLRELMRSWVWGPHEWG